MKIIKIIAIFIVVFLLADAIMTFVAVQDLKIAKEGNPCNLLMWQLLGYPLGESLRIILAIGAGLFLYSRAKKMKPLPAFLIMIFVLAVVMFVVYNNASILFEYFAVK